MAQKKYWSWQDDDSTNDLNQRDVITAPHGLYCGFDAVLAAGLNLSLSHTTTGRVKVDASLNSTAPIGMWKSRQGVVIEEDAAITLPISAGNATNPRIDLIVGEHSYQVGVVGGATATYKVIQGTPAVTPAVPALTDPLKQVVLGQLYVPALTSNLNGVGVSYTKSLTPAFAGSSLVYMDRVQTVPALKLFSALGLYDTGNTVSIDNAGVIALPATLNSYFEVTAATINGLFHNLTSITSPSNPSKGTLVWFKALEPIKITTTGNITANSDRYIRANRIFVMRADGAGNWSVVRGGEALIGANKFYAAQIFSGAVEVLNTSGHLVQGWTANMIDLDSSQWPAGAVLKSIKGSAITELNTSNNTWGGLLYIRCDKSTEIRHQDTGLPVGNKPLNLPVGINYTVPAGAVLTFIERPLQWELISVAATGGGLTFQPVTLSANYSTYQANTLRAGKDTFGFVHLEGAVTRNAGAGNIIGNIPAGLRPPIAYNTIIADNLSTAQIVIRIDSTGDISFITTTMSGYSYYFTGVAFLGA